MLGARLVSVQKLLGHSDPKITTEVYGHPPPATNAPRLTTSPSGCLRSRRPRSRFGRWLGQIRLRLLHPCCTRAAPETTGPEPLPIQSDPGLFIGGV